MKKALVIGLALLMLSLSFKDIFSYIQYFVHQDLISTTLCLDRADPISMCYGSCYLEQSIKNNYTQHQEFPVAEKQAKSLSIHLFTIQKLSIEWELKPTFTALKDQWQGNYQFTFLNSIYRPPKFS